MYTKIYEGVTFGPGGSVPGDKVLFKNCTFVASVQIGDHCDFIGCTFQKCCPKPYSNVSKTGVHCRFWDTTLESVNVGPHAELYNTNQSGYLVTIASVLPKGNKSEDRGGSGVSTSSAACGQRFNSKEFKTGKEFYPCGKTEAEGMINADVTLEQCGCK